MTVTKEYAIAYKEVLEILKYISEEDIKKIPQDIIQIFNKNSDLEYKMQYNPEKTLDEQNISETAKTIIAILFRDYWATDEQRQKIEKVQEIERKKNSNTKEILKENISSNTNTLDGKQINKLPIEYKKENIWIKVFNFIKIIFKKQ